jgi:hypothetical protein
MAVRTALRVRLPVRADEAAKILHSLADAGIRLDLFVGCAGAQETTVELLAADPACAARLLAKAEVPVEEFRVACGWLPDLPLCLAQACETLNAAGICIDGVHVVGGDATRGQHVLIESSDAERADELLWALHY